MLAKCVLDDQGRRGGAGIFIEAQKGAYGLVRLGPPLDFRIYGLKGVTGAFCPLSGVL